MNILGILVSRNFSFDQHITNLLKRCNQTLYLLLKLKRMAYNKHELTHIYTALVTSAITYGVEAYGSSGDHYYEKNRLHSEKGSALGNDRVVCQSVSI